jgi:hypothetical protein
VGEQLEKTGTFEVRSSEGYIVGLEQNHGVVYRDQGGEVVIGYSWLGKPSGISLHPSTLRARGLDEDRVDLIAARAMRALQFLGYYVELF